MHTSTTARKLRRKLAMEARMKEAGDSPTTPEDSVIISLVEPRKLKTRGPDIAVTAVAIANSEPVQEPDGDFMVQLEKEMGRMLWPNNDAAEEEARDEGGEEAQVNDTNTADTTVAIDSDDFVTRLGEEMSRLLWNSEKEADNDDCKEEKEKGAENSATKPNIASVGSAVVTKVAMHNLPATQVERKVLAVRIIAELCRLIIEKQKEKHPWLIPNEKERRGREIRRFEVLKEHQKQRLAVIDAAKKKREEMDRVRKLRDAADLATALEDYPSDISEVDFPSGPAEITITEGDSTTIREISKKSQLDTQHDNVIEIKVEPPSLKKRKITDFFPIHSPRTKRALTTTEYIASKENGNKSFPPFKFVHDGSSSHYRLEAKEIISQPPRHMLLSLSTPIRDRLRSRSIWKKNSEVYRQGLEYPGGPRAEKPGDEQFVGKTDEVLPSEQSIHTYDGPTVALRVNNTSAEAWTGLEERGLLSSDIMNAYGRFVKAAQITFPT